MTTPRLPTVVADGGQSCVRPDDSVAASSVEEASGPPVSTEPSGDAAGARALVGGGDPLKPVLASPPVRRISSETLPALRRARDGWMLGAEGLAYPPSVRLPADWGMGGARARSTDRAPA